MKDDDPRKCHVGRTLLWVMVGMVGFMIFVRFRSMATWLDTEWGTYATGVFVIIYFAYMIRFYERCGPRILPGDTALSAYRSFLWLFEHERRQSLREMEASLRAGRDAMLSEDESWWWVSFCTAWRAAHTLGKGGFPEIAPFLKDLIAFIRKFLGKK